MRCLRSIVAFAVVTLLAVHAAPAPVPGQSTFTADRYVESVAGNLPIVLTAPHGGALKPDSIANRKEGVLGADLNSLELARALAAELFARTGRHPALVASHLHRSKLDPNREIKEAAQGDPTAESAWRDFHAAIRAALDASVARHGFAFLIDLHGHSHPIARLELGYALDSAQLNRSDATFDASGKKTANARTTVKHNGTVIHDNIELPHATTAAPLGEGATPGPLYLQDHGNPVVYRNVWISPK